MFKDLIIINSKMETQAPRFTISDYLLNTTFSSSEEMRKGLFDKGILTKDYPEEGLMLLYHKFDTPANSTLEKECRSLVVNSETKQIVSYTCDVPIMNNKGFRHMMSNNNQLLYNHCYEGTLLSLYNFNSKWYLSTRRCLNSKDSVLSGCQVSHYDMFLQVLEQSGLTFETFTNNLDTNLSYYFVLLHHMNKHVIDYSYCYGDNYKRLCLVSVKDKEMRELNLYTLNLSFLSEYVFLPVVYETLEPFYNACNTMDVLSKPLDEGVIVRVWNEEMSRYNLIKLQQPNYIYHSLLRQQNGEHKSKLYLYQINKLTDTNMILPISSTFKVCTSELFELFKLCWSLKTGKQQTKEVYDELPNEYKTMLYGLRGVYFKNKSTGQSLPWLKINDIYNFLKDTTPELMVSFLEARNTFHLKLNNDTEYLKQVNRMSTFLNLSVYEQSKLFTQLL